ncbi:hypothetical protein TYRP_010369 [Tyrophagus putrescentiae]|nr:hypothetical protein TYRP_010369 [Tyrophagus putrescentiae]
MTSSLNSTTLVSDFCYDSFRKGSPQANICPAAYHHHHITIITKTSTKTAAASSPSLVAQPFSNDHQYHHQANTFRLTADQCPHLATIFTAASGLTGATYLDSCSARFLRLDRLYDDALLLGVSLAGWHHGNRTVVNLATVAKQITGSSSGSLGDFDYLNAALVVRLDHCVPTRKVPNGTTSHRRSVTVRISPPPRLSSVEESNNNNGLASVELTEGQVGELLVTSFSNSLNGFRPDIYEVALVDDDNDHHQQSQCSLANTRLLICGRRSSSADQDHQQQEQQPPPNCQVHLFDSDQRLVECRCDYSTTGSQYLYALVVAGYLLLLTVGSLTIKSGRRRAELKLKQQRNSFGLTEEHVVGNVASRAHAYHYRVIYRVACPTVTFDRRSTLSFEVLGSGGGDLQPLRPLFAAVGFAMAEEENDDPSIGGGHLHWNVFTTDVFLPAPLPRVRAVRTGHDGRPQTGLYLFDVTVVFVRRPKLVELMEEGDEDEVDDFEPRSPKKKKKKTSLSRRHPQRLPIYAYILDHPNVYQRAEKGVPIELPPVIGGGGFFTSADLPPPSLPYLKVLAWLATSEALLFSPLVLERLYLRFEMLLSSVLAAAAIAAVILSQLVVIIWLHGRLGAESLRHQLLYDCLAGRAEEEEEEENDEDDEEEEDDSKQKKKSKQKRRKKKKSKKKQKPPPPWNWGHLLDTLLLLLLLAAIAACLGTLLLFGDHQRLLLLSQPPLKAFYAEVIALLSLTLLGGSLWLTLESGGLLFCFSHRRRLQMARVATEERLMAESNQRGGLLQWSSNTSMTSNSRTTTTTTKTSKTKTKTAEEKKKRKRKSSGRRRSSSPSSPGTTTTTAPITIGTPKGTFEMISSSDDRNMR